MNINGTIRWCLMWLTIWVAMVAHYALGADLRWVGGAQDVAQQSTATFGGTWVTGEKVTATINNKSVTVTLGSSVSTANVADVMARAINANTATASLLGNETRNVGGQTIPEFTEVVATNAGNVLTLASVTPGTPFTVTFSTNSAAGTSTPATPVAATGKNWVDNAANYDTGTLPANGDVLHIDAGTASMLYALDYFRTNNIGLNLDITTDYTGRIGRPLVTALGYIDYRANRYFQYDSAGVTHSVKVRAGYQGGGGTPGPLYLDFGNSVSTDILITAGRGAVTATPTIFLAGGDAGTGSGPSLTIANASVAIEPADAPTAATANTFKAAAYKIGVPGGGAGGTFVYVGATARTQLTLNDVIEQHSGTTNCEAPLLVGADVSDLRLYGGTWEQRNWCSDVYVYPGATFYPNPTLTGQGAQAIYLYAGPPAGGGVLDTRRANQEFSNTGIKMYAGSSFFNSNGLMGNTIDFVGCRPSQTTLELPLNREIDFSAAAVP